MMPAACCSATDPGRIFLAGKCGAPRPLLIGCLACGALPEDPCQIAPLGTPDVEPALTTDANHPSRLDHANAVSRSARAREISLSQPARSTWCNGPSAIAKRSDHSSQRDENPHEYWRFRTPGLSPSQARSGFEMEKSRRFSLCCSHSNHCGPFRNTAGAPQRGESKHQWYAQVTATLEQANSPEGFQPSQAVGRIGSFAWSSPR